MRSKSAFILAAALGLGGCGTTVVTPSYDKAAQAAADRTAALQERVAVINALSTVRDGDGNLSPAVERVIISTFMQANPQDRAVLKEKIERRGFGRELYKAAAEEFAASSLGQLLAKFQAVAGGQDRQKSYIAALNVVDGYRAAGEDDQSRVRNAVVAKLKQLAALPDARQNVVASERDAYAAAYTMIDRPNTVFCLSADGTKLRSRLETRQSAAQVIAVCAVP